MNSNSVAYGVLKAVGVIVLICAGVVGCMAYFGSQMDPGQRYADACRAEVPADQVKWCMAGLDRTYRGPSDPQRMRNAAAQWEADRQDGIKRYGSE